jgi:amidase
LLNANDPSDKLPSSGRRQFLRTGTLGLSAAALVPQSVANKESYQSCVNYAVPSFELDEATIADLQGGMKSGRFSAHDLAQKYLSRIAEVDQGGPKLNSVIEVNPDALAIADALDKERKEKGPRGPMHGIPVLIKDNIDTADKMQTTAGSLALLGSHADSDSFVAKKLRDAGAVILGKTNLSEWANIRSSHSTSGWSGRGGLTKNPYALDRNPCGSSSGTGAGVSGNLCAAGVGTETDGSIVCPSSANGVVGLKPTLGLIGRSGIIPIAHSQDTAGPIARTVTDMAILLTALAGIDERDPATSEMVSRPKLDYTKYLAANGLRGARIGVARKYFGFHDATEVLMQNVIDEMKSAGAVIVDPADIPSFGKFDDTEMTVLMYELKADLNAYLAKRPDAGVKTLKDVMDFNINNQDKELQYFGQDLFLKAEEKGPLTSKEYVDALAANHRLSRQEGIDAIMEQQKLDAIIAPTAGPAWITDLVDGDHVVGGSSNVAAVAGYPDISVPAGYISGLPVGLSFFGRAWSEPTLIKIAFAFEQLTKARKAPKFLPTVNFS